MQTTFKKILLVLYIIFSLYVGLDSSFHYNVSDSEKIEIIKDYEHKKDSILILSQENKIKTKQILIEKNSKCSCCGNNDINNLSVFSCPEKGIRVFCNVCSKSNSLDEISDSEFSESDRCMFKKTREYQSSIDSYITRSKVFKNKLYVDNTWFECEFFFLCLLLMTLIGCFGFVILEITFGVVKWILRR